MKATVRTRKDDSMEDLLFNSVESAQNFVDFVILYQHESGAGNGYGAYWVFENKIEQTDGNSDRFTRELDSRRIDRMIRSIAHARSGGSGIVTIPSMTYGVEDGAIAFQLWGFDDRQKPGAGDMYRIVEYNETTVGLLNDGASKEGRVLEVIGDSIQGYLGEDDEGNRLESAKVHTIPLDSVMKIPDWLAEHRQRRNSTV